MRTATVIAGGAIIVAGFFTLYTSSALAHDANAAKVPKVAPSIDDPYKEQADRTFQKFEDRAFPLSKAKWGGRDVVPVTIPVCWEPPSMVAAYADGRATVQRATTEQWQKNSMITFSGWQKCVPNNKGIRILVEDSGPHVKRLGEPINGVKNGMVLNFTYKNWGYSCQQSIEYCNYAIAVHEFGHALFFAHEQNRPDTPGECNDLPQGSDGDVLMTPWDWDSVMNYCNPKYSNDGVLSRWDVYALQKFYGKP